MSSSSVCARISQSLDILVYLSPQMVFEFHRVEMGREIEDLVLGQVSDSDCIM